MQIGLLLVPVFAILEMQIEDVSMGHGNGTAGPGLSAFNQTALNDFMWRLVGPRRVAWLACLLVFFFALAGCCFCTCCDALNLLRFCVDDPFCRPPARPPAGFVSFFVLQPGSSLPSACVATTSGLNGFFTDGLDGANDTVSASMMTAGPSEAISPAWSWGGREYRDSRVLLLFYFVASMLAVAAEYASLWVQGQRRARHTRKGNIAAMRWNSLAKICAAVSVPAAAVLMTSLSPLVRFYGSVRASWHAPASQKRAAVSRTSVR